MSGFEITSMISPSCQTFFLFETNFCVGGFGGESQTWYGSLLGLTGAWEGEELTQTAQETFDGLNVIPPSPSVPHTISLCTCPAPPPRLVPCKPLWGCQMRPIPV